MMSFLNKTPERMDDTTHKTGCLLRVMSTKWKMNDSTLAAEPIVKIVLNLGED